MSTRKAYLVGSGIASLASAAYLMRDGKIPGANICIFEEAQTEGGALDGSGDPKKGYIMRGGRMLNFSYGCTYDLLSFIPSLHDPSKMVLDEIKEFNEKVKAHSNCRLVRNGQKVDTTSMGFSNKDRLDLLEVMIRTEDSLGRKRINECFRPEFFETNFWYMWATMFAFQPWHSAVELKRYLHRFIQEFPRINTLANVDRTPYNQFDSIVRPLVQWLKKEGVRFEMGAQVIDLEFKEIADTRTVEKIIYLQDGLTKEVLVELDDMVFVTNGSMTANSTLGSKKAAPLLNKSKADGAWALWEKLATGRSEFGHPENFSDRIDESKCLSFTVTQKGDKFFKLMENFTHNTAGTGTLVTLVDSNWLMSVVLAYQPHFLNQPPDVKVFWGYGLFVDRVGNFVKKKMSDCNGDEIMIELCNHLRFNEDIEEILESSNCIPCMMPFVTSPFLTRTQEDRPAVVPEGSTNLAFVGQFCEVPDDVVFTVEYSVRAAQMAVYALLDIDKKPVPVYEGMHDLRVLFDAIKTTYQSGEQPTEEHPLNS